MTGRNEKLSLSLFLSLSSVPYFHTTNSSFVSCVLFSCVVRGRKPLSLALALSLSFHPSIVEHFAEVVLRDQRLNPIALAIVIARRPAEGRTDTDCGRPATSLGGLSCIR